MGLSLKERSALTRVIEEGIRRSAGRLGRMSGTEWGIMTSSINEIPVVRMLSWFDRNKAECLGARFAAGARVPLEIMVLFPGDCAESITDAVTRRYADKVGALANRVELTIGEVANIIAQSVLGALADEYGVEIILSVPAVSRGRKAELVSGALDDYDGANDVLLMSHIELYAFSLSAECTMVIMANTERLRRILDRSGGD